MLATVDRRTGRKRRTIDEARKADSREDEAQRKVGAACKMSYQSLWSGHSGPPHADHLLQVPPAYNPKARGVKVQPALLEKGKDKRDARGRLVFKDCPSFRPTLTPKHVIQAGSFGGCEPSPTMLVKELLLILHLQVAL